MKRLITPVSRYSLVLSLAALPWIVIQPNLAVPPPATTSGTNPVDEPICYFRNSQQQVINLSRLCQGLPGTLRIIRLDYQSNLVIGRIHNQSRQLARGIRIHYQVVSETGQLIEQNSVAALPTALQPDQVATFETVLPARSRLANLYITSDSTP